MDSLFLDDPSKKPLEIVYDTNITESKSTPNRKQQGSLLDIIFLRFISRLMFSSMLKKKTKYTININLYMNRCRHCKSIWSCFNTALVVSSGWSRYLSFQSRLSVATVVTSLIVFYTHDCIWICHVTSIR